MGGIFTQSRNLGGPPVEVITTQTVEGPRRRVTGIVTDIHNQSTTSFRSGGRFDLSEDILGDVDASVYASPRVALADSYDTGHEFDTTTKRRILHQREGVVASDYGWTVLTTRGPMVLTMQPGWDTMNQGKFIEVPKMTSSEIIQYGQRAIANCYPTAPTASLSVLLGELLSDGLPSLVGLASLREDVKLYRSLGAEYLNVEFGWKPFVKDLQKLGSALQNASRILSQYQRDSGRIVRRRFSFPTEIRTTESSWTAPYGHIPVYGFSEVLAPTLKGKPGLITDRISQRYWFSGAFTYYLDIGDNLVSKLREYEQLGNKLLGSRITPDVLWELAPWSWLIDWKATIGTSVQVGSAFQNDGLVMKYGYLMRHTVAERTVSADVFDARTELRKLTVTNTYRTVRKERVKATPYGFGLSPDDFSIRQWAILAALGLTKAPKSLR